MPATQEYYVNISLKGNEIKDVVVEVVPTEPTTGGKAGQVVTCNGNFYISDGTNYHMLSREATVTTVSNKVTALEGTVGNENSGLVKDVADIKALIGDGTGSGTIVSRVTKLEESVGKPAAGETAATGLYKSVADNAAAAAAAQSTANSASQEAGKNTTAISGLTTRMDTAEADIDKLQEAVGTDGVTPTGLYSKIATVKATADKNTQDIAAVKATADAAATKTYVDTELGKKVTAVEGMGLSQNSYTTDEKNKLKDIAAGAQVNVLEKVSVKGSDGVTSALKITDKGVTVDLSGYATKASVASAYKAKGSVKTTKDLPTNAEVGDVWNVETAFSEGGKTYPAGTNVVYVEYVDPTTGAPSGTFKWDPLAGMTDLSDYSTTEEMTSKISTAKSEAISSANGYTDTEVGKKVTKLDAPQREGTTYTKVVLDEQGLVKSGSEKITETDIDGTISASKISGTLATDNIPELGASKVTSGEFTLARIPTIPLGGDDVSGVLPVAKLGIEMKTLNFAGGATSGVIAHGLDGVPFSVEAVDSAGVSQVGIEIKRDATNITLTGNVNLPALTIYVIGKRKLA